MEDNVKVCEVCNRPFVRNGRGWNRYTLTASLRRIDVSVLQALKKVCNDEVQVANEDGHICASCYVKLEHDCKTHIVESRLYVAAKHQLQRTPLSSPIVKRCKVLDGPLARSTPNELTDQLPVFLSTARGMLASSMSGYSPSAAVDMMDFNDDVDGFNGISGLQSGSTTDTFLLKEPYVDHSYMNICPSSQPGISSSLAKQIDDVDSLGSSSLRPAAVADTSKGRLKRKPARRKTKPQDGDVTRCICNFTQDDGFMISCNICGVWQHVDCMGVDKSDKPNSYLCELCMPRPVDIRRAIRLQIQKKEHELSRVANERCVKSAGRKQIRKLGSSNSQSGVGAADQTNSIKCKKKVAAVSAVPLDQLDDITECPICTELYTDPRVLPCIHTYCLKCIEKWGSDKIHDGKLACPVCRKEITITKEGFTDLPKNFFVGKLLEVRKLASALSVKESLSCDVCSEDQGKQNGVGTVPTATVYCIECRRNMCQMCLGCHKKFRFPTAHKLVEIEKQQEVEELLKKFSESVCDKHQDKNLEIYCSDCKMVTCMMCYITSHNGHKCSDVKEVAEKMCTQMKTDAIGFIGKVDECKKLLQQLEKERKEFGSKMEKEIEQKARELDVLISGSEEQEKKMESLRGELEGRLLMVENLKKYSDELRTKGTPCDIARMASSLHDRAVELMKFDVRNSYNSLAKARKRLTTM